MSPAPQEQVSEFRQRYRDATQVTLGNEVQDLLDQGWTFDSINHLRALTEHAIAHDTGCVALFHPVANPQAKARFAVVTAGLTSFTRQLTISLRVRNFRDTPADIHAAALRWTALLASLQEKDAAQYLNNHTGEVREWIEHTGDHALLAYASGCRLPDVQAMAAEQRLDLAFLARRAAAGGLDSPDPLLLGVPLDPEVRTERLQFETDYYTLTGRTSMPSEILDLFAHGGRSRHLRALRACAEQFLSGSGRLFNPIASSSPISAMPLTMRSAIGKAWIARAADHLAGWVALGLTPDQALTWLRISLAVPADQYPDGADRPYSDDYLTSIAADLGATPAILALAAGLAPEEIHDLTEANALPDEATLRTMASLRGHHL